MVDSVLGDADRRRPGHLDFASARTQVRRADQTERDRERPFQAEQRGFEAQAGNVLQDALAQRDSAEVVDVAAQRVFGICDPRRAVHEPLGKGTGGKGG